MTVLRKSQRKQSSKGELSVGDVALEMTELPAEELDRLLDMRAMTEGGLPG